MIPDPARTGQADPSKAGEELPYLIPREVLDDLADAVWAEVIKLPAVSQQWFVSEFRNRRKSKSVAYLLAFALGAHYLYLGERKTQFTFWLTGGGMGIWAILDLWRIPKLVREKNRQIAKELLALTSAIAGSSTAGRPRQ